MAAVLFVVAICAANLLVYWLGPWWSPINAFALIGLDLALRDSLHDKHGLLGASAIALIAGLLSYLINPAGGMIALASAASFVLASLADGSVYQALSGKTPMQRMNGSNIAGAAVDSLAFPSIAFGALMPEIVALQFIAKIAGGFIWSLVLRRASI